MQYSSEGSRPGGVGISRGSNRSNMRSQSRGAQRSPRLSTKSTVNSAPPDYHEDPVQVAEHRMARTNKIGDRLTRSFSKLFASRGDLTTPSRPATKESAASSVPFSVLSKRITSGVAHINRIRSIPASLGVLKCSLLGLTIFGFAWTTVACVLSTLMVQLYIYDVPVRAQEHYFLKGCLPLAKAEVSKVLLAAYRSPEALHFAVTWGALGATPSYDLIELAVSPSFQARPALYSAQLTFDSGMTVAAQPSWDDSGVFSLALQSNVQDDCAELGDSGCGLVSSRPTAAMQRQFNRGVRQLQATPNATYRSEFSSAAQLLESNAGELFGSYTIDFVVGQEATMHVVGHFAVDLSKINLQDAADVAKGLVFLVDDTGHVLASNQAAYVTTTAAANSSWGAAIWGPSGNRLRHVREVPRVSWPGDVLAAFSGSQWLEAADDRLVREGDALFVMSWLPSPLHRFALVVASPTTDAFTDSKLNSLTLASVSIVFLPYVGFAAGFCALLVYQCLTTQNLEGEDVSAASSTRPDTAATQVTTISSSAISFWQFPSTRVQTLRSR